MCSSKTQGLISPRQDWSARLQEHFMNDKEQEFVRRFEFLFLSLEKWPSHNRKHKLFYKNKETRYLDHLESRWTIARSVRSVDSMLIW